ncbi:MAG: fibronectin type III domain-containing protein, partial [Rhodospirillaceae bacterium]|nr:fibronectin type III domain-containing protein [Rhodospirillaceae bacterium]
MLVLSATAGGQGAPTNLQVDSTTTSTVTLSWTAPVGGTAPTAYNVYRCDEPCTLDTNNHWIAWVDQSNGTDLDLTDTNDNSDPAEDGGTSPVVAAKTYRYVVASAPSGNWSNQVTATTPAARSLAAPTGLKTTATSATGITIGWTAPADDGRGPPAAYNVYRCTLPCVLDSNDWLAWVTDGTTYADTGVTAGASYLYAVAAYRDWEGAWSRKIIAVAQAPTTPGAPAGLFASDTSETSITLKWSEPGDGGGTPEAYNVYRCEQTEGDPPCTPAWIAWVTNGTTFTDTAMDTSPAEQGGTSPVVAYRTYLYAVAAYRTGLAGDRSPVLSVKAESILTVPSEPVEFTARGSGNKIALSWREPLWLGGSGIDGYTLYRGDGDSCDQLSEYKSGIPPA